MTVSKPTSAYTVVSQVPDCTNVSLETPVWRITREAGMGSKQGRQCTYNVTLQRDRETTAAVKKAISIPYSECVYVTFVRQHAMRMRHVVICDLSGYTIFFHIIS